jgi:hypothetical protein
LFAGSDLKASFKRAKDRAIGRNQRGCGRIRPCFSSAGLMVELPELGERIQAVTMTLMERSELDQLIKKAREQFGQQLRQLGQILASLKLRRDK